MSGPGVFGAGGGLRSGEVARAAGVNRQTLRYDERRGLLAAPARSGAGHRLYPAHAVTLIRMIKRAQRLGLNLGEIAQVIASPDASRALAPIARRKMAAIDATMAELAAARAALRPYAGVEGCAAATTGGRCSLMPT
jgi:DNA-binding transcriptional MerR regulator